MTLGGLTDAVAPHGLEAGLAVAGQPRVRGPAAHRALQRRALRRRDCNIKKNKAKRTIFCGEVSFKGTHSKRPSRVRQACVCMSAAEYVQLSQRAHSSEASWQSRRRSQKLSTGTHSKRPSRGVAHCAELPEHLKSLLPAQQEQLLYLSRKYLWGILFFTHGYQSAKLEGTSN